MGERWDRGGGSNGVEAGRGGIEVEGRRGFGGMEQLGHRGAQRDSCEAKAPVRREGLDQQASIALGHCSLPRPMPVST